MRIDKFLWCVRLYKTRTLATIACKTGKIVSNSDTLKPSFESKVGFEFIVKNSAIKKTFRIIEFPNSRVAGKLVVNYLEEITSEEDKKRNELIIESRKENASFEYGKPTKKDRRKIDKFKKGES